jgi:Spy/CpxP family protein refolding chaperone
LETLNRQLNLTDEEKEKIRLLLKHESERIRDVRSNTSLSPGEVHRRIAMVRRNTRDRITEVLTAKQKQKWQELNEEHRGTGPEGGQGKPEGARSAN